MIISLGQDPAKLERIRERFVTLGGEDSDIATLVSDPFEDGIFH